MSDLREPMRIKVCQISFQKYTKTPSDRIKKKKGPLLLTIYFSDYGTQWIFTTPCRYEKNALQCFNPRYFSKPSFFSRTSKSLSMGVFVDDS